MIALIPVRAGELPLGADESVAEAGGACLVVGEDTKAAAGMLTAAAHVTCVELGAFAPGTWAASLSTALAAQSVVILPASPDGRDLAPRVAHALDRPLLAGAIAVEPDRVVVARQGGLVSEEHRPTGPFVATLEPGVRGVGPVATNAVIDELSVARIEVPDPEVREVIAPDPETMDLAEAPRIVAGGAGLGGPAPFDVLRHVAAALGASWGASRVAADLGWVPPDRFIGTTGVTVDAGLYVAIGISGAVQHVSGLGDPDHIIAVNTDASAPMMAMADVAIVADGVAVLEALHAKLGL